MESKNYKVQTRNYITNQEPKDNTHDGMIEQGDTGTQGRDRMDKLTKRRQGLTYHTGSDLITDETQLNTERWWENRQWEEVESEIENFKIKTEITEPETQTVTHTDKE